MNSPGRFEKRLVAANGSANAVRFLQTSDANHEREFIVDEIRRTQRREQRPFSDFAILLRGSRDVADVKQVLRQENVPCGVENDGVCLMTLHASKGLEFPVVYLPGIQEDTLPHWNAIKAGSLAVEEERRLFYVGVTRAKECLTLSSTLRRGKYSCTPSRFALGLIQQRLVDHKQLAN